MSLLSFRTHDAKIQRFVRVCCLPALVLSWLLLCFYGLVTALEHHHVVGLTDGEGHPLGDCFINFWSAARLTWQGQIGDIYQWEAFHDFEQMVVGGPLVYFHYSYPPVLPLLTLPIAFFPYVVAYGVWIVATWVLFYGALKFEGGAHPFLLSIATPAFIINLASGQNGALTAALLGGGLVLLPKRPVLAGILFGLLCFKPQLVFLVPVALICGRQGRALLMAAITSSLLIILSAILYGPDLWIHYFQTTEKLKHYVLEDNTAQSWQQFVSVFVAAREGGLGIFPAYCVQGLCALVALGAVIKIWMSSASHEIRSAALILGTFLATPYAMDYDLVVMAFVVVWLGRSYPKHHLAAFLLLLAPIVSRIFGTSFHVGLGPFFLLPAFFLTLTSYGRPSMPKESAHPSR